MLSTVTENIEQSLWSALGTTEESIMLLNHLGEHFANASRLDLSVLYYKKAHEAEQRPHRQAIGDAQRANEPGQFTRAGGRQL